MTRGVAVQVPSLARRGLQLRHHAGEPGIAVLRILGLPRPGNVGMLLAAMRHAAGWPILAHRGMRAARFAVIAGGPCRIRSSLWARLVGLVVWGEGPTAGHWNRHRHRNVRRAIHLIREQRLAEPQDT